MFERSMEKVQEAEHHLLGMQQARSEAEFRASFNACIGSMNGAWDNLKAEGAALPDFPQWREAKWAEIEGDELLSYLHDARIDDFHKARRPVVATAAYIDHLNTADLGEPPEGAALVMGADGPSWLLDADTPRERKVPLTAGGAWSVAVQLTAPPYLTPGTRPRGPESHGRL
jgi:hypothetical protein